MSALPETRFDVLVAGGGLVGGSLSIALAQAGLQVGLVEAVPPDSSAQPSFDDRTIALSRGSFRILSELGIWERLASDTWPIRRIHVSQQGRFGTAMIDAREQGVADLGFVIKSHAIGAALWSCIRELENIHVLCPARVAATELQGDVRAVSIDLDGVHHTVQAPLLAIADGARSGLRTQVGIAATERDYDQVAVVANVQIDTGRTDYLAYERFTDEGPLAMLPGADGRYTMVLARNAATVQSVLDMDDASMLDMLQSLLGFRLGRIRRIGQRQAYPLYLVTADRLTAERAVLVGNAANGLHPVAAQGFNLGLRDVASLAETLADNARQVDFDPGAAAVLEHYAAWREPDQAKVVRFTDGLIRLFGVGVPGAAAARGLSLQAFDLVPGAKQELARQTMGLAGRMSRLARGLRL